MNQRLTLKHDENRITHHVRLNVRRAIELPILIDGVASALTIYVCQREQGNGEDSQQVMMLLDAARRLMISHSDE